MAKHTVFVLFQHCLVVTVELVPVFVVSVELLDVMEVDVEVMLVPKHRFPIPLALPPNLQYSKDTDWNPAMSALWKEHTDTNGSMLSPATRRDGWIQESHACSACLAHKHLMKSCQHLPKESAA